MKADRAASEEQLATLRRRLQASETEGTALCASTALGAEAISAREALGAEVGHTHTLSLTYIYTQ